MLLSKKYILGHFGVALIVVLCCAASVWQFSRLSDRKDLNSKIQSRMERKEVTLDSLLNVDSTESEVALNEYRRIRITGTYLQSGEVLISGRFVDGEPGYNVVTPIVLSNGNGVVFVNRGWIKLTLGDAIVAGSANNEQIVPIGGWTEKREVVGLVRKNEAKQILNKSRNIEKNNAVSTRISTDVFGELLDTKSSSIFPFWAQLEFQKLDGKKVIENAGVEKTYPIAVAKPELTEKNHFSYAIQWLMLGLVALATWIAICMKALKSGSKK